MIARNDNNDDENESNDDVTMKQNGTYLFKLFKLSIAELLKCICVTLLNLAKPHITNTVTHLAHIEESRAKGLWQKMLF